MWRWCGRHGRVRRSGGTPNAANIAGAALPRGAAPPRRAAPGLIAAQGCGRDGGWGYGRRRHGGQTAGRHVCAVHCASCLQGVRACAGCLQTVCWRSRADVSSMHAEAGGDGDCKEFRTAWCGWWGAMSCRDSLARSVAMQLPRCHWRHGRPCSVAAARFSAGRAVTGSVALPGPAPVGTCRYPMGRGVLHYVTLRDPC